MGLLEGDRDTRVLLVDDDPIILDLLSAGLTRAGYQVNACAEGEEAVAQYRRATPDIAVLDVGLPDIPGTELARQLLIAEYRPILILSNYNDLDIVRQAITSGVVGYLVKPLSVEQLIPSLETSVSRYRQRRERIATHLGDDTVTADHLAECMDRFPFGLLIVNEQHHPIYRNARGRGLLEAGVLHIDPAGRLRAGGGNDAFVPVMEQALGKLELSRTVPCAAARLETREGERLHAWAAPLQGGADRVGENLAALAVFDGEQNPSYTWEALKTLYGLTRKETRLVNGLLQGQSLEDYCESNFVTANTARTHLKSIYRKTGTHRQSELVRLFASMFMPVEELDVEGQRGRGAS
jgi:DNA-binding NarL/FixJ family response regulator